jgi:hypothetical protein
MADSLFSGTNNFDRQIKDFDAVALTMLTDACARKLVALENQVIVSERFYRIADLCACHGGVGDFVAPVKEAAAARAENAARIADVQTRQAALEKRLKLSVFDSARLVTLGLVIGFSCGKIFSDWMA